MNVDSLASASEIFFMLVLDLCDLWKVWSWLANPDPDTAAPLIHGFAGRGFGYPRLAAVWEHHGEIPEVMARKRPLARGLSSG